jgi:hypothetical protein
VPAPPQKPPLRPGAPAPGGGGDALERSRREKDELTGEVTSVEEEVEALKAKYEMWFLGVERREPARWREDVKKKVARLKTAFTRNAGLRFRIQSLNARYLAYERMWLRSAREKEDGTYRRDVFKARLHAREAQRKAEAEARAQGQEAAAAAPAKPGATAAPAAPAPGAAPAAAAAARPPAAAKAPTPAPAGAGDAQLRALYEQYIAAKKRCNEDVSRLTYDAVARSIAKQVPELMTRYKARSVEFKVEVKDGRAVLKAIPKA